ncbi:hypothetical protein BGZ75_004649 [Mortierella antarctica]|nr:hypothetical protein BGZ75_004649 [Mortierella antarctica]
MLENATRVSAIGVAGIVHSCPNLYALDLRLCTEVSFAIFKEPAWKCSNLEILHMNHLGFNTAGTPSQLGDLYRQLGRLTRLLSLRFGEQRFNLRLVDIGREALERLVRILELELVGMIEPSSSEEIIWLVTRLKSLRYLQLDEAALESLEPAVFRDLQIINRDLEFVLPDGREFSPRI